MQYRRCSSAAAAFIAIAITLAVAIAVIVAFVVLSVHVTVLELLGGGFADIDDLHIEMKSLAGKRVVRIERDILALDLDHRDDLYAVFAVRLELHAWRDLDVLAEVLFLNLEHKGFVPIAVGVFRSDAARDRVAGILAFELFFETRDDILIPMEIHERLAPLG